MTEKTLSRMASLSARIDALYHRKRQLDDKIAAEQARPAPDTLRLRQLKARKLFLRDQMARYEGVIRTLKPLAGHVAARTRTVPC